MPLDPELEAILDYLKGGSTGRQRNGPDEHDVAEHARRLFGVEIKKPLTQMERLLLPQTRPYTREDVGRARQWARQWEDYSFPNHEVDTWLKAGLEPGDACLAAQLVEEGIEPFRLTERLEHPRTGEQLTILTLVRQAPTRAGELRTGLCGLLDEAGVERTRRAPVMPKWLRPHRPHSA